VAQIFALRVVHWRGSVLECVNDFADTDGGDAVPPRMCANKGSVTGDPVVSFTIFYPPVV
jgi:hypothetical protein